MLPRFSEVEKAVEQGNRLIEFPLAKETGEARNGLVKRCFP